jgi:hypothetical protein
MGLVSLPFLLDANHPRLSQRARPVWDPEQHPESLSISSCDFAFLFRT